MSELLLKHGADVNAKDKSGDTPLHNAAVYGCTETCKLLLEHGAYVNADNDDGQTPMNLADNYGYTGIFNLLRGRSTDE